MIIEERIPTGIKHYSDSGFKIRQVETGILYDSASDIYPCPYTYEETDEEVSYLLNPASDLDIATAIREVVNDNQEIISVDRSVEETERISDGRTRP